MPGGIMAFTPLTLDGPAAAERMLSWGTFAKRACLAAVHQAFPFAKSDAPGTYTSARVQWERIPDSRKHKDRNPPKGVCVFWDLRSSNTLDPRPGHIAISWGNGRVVSTDTPDYGRIGITTIAEIEKRWGAKYLGWADVVGGHNIAYATPAGTPHPVPVPAPKPEPVPVPEEEDDDMPLHTVHARADKTNGTHEGDWTLSDPDAGKDLLPFDPKKGDKTRMRRTVYSDGKGGVINEYRGFYATNIKSVFLAWARTWAKGGSQIHSVTVEADYQTIQTELSRVATKN